MRFWSGFYKRADALIGGQGFSGSGKGNLPTGYAEQGRLQGTASTEETKPDHSLIDKQRDAQNYGLMFNERDVGPTDSNPHIFY